MTLKNFFTSVFASLFFEYHALKFVVISDKYVALLHRFFQIIVIGYAIGYVMIYQKGYQRFDYDAASEVVIKVKGVSLQNDSSPQPHSPLVWDIVDSIVPPLEKSEVFLVTNQQRIHAQRQSVCAESASVEQARCHADSDCLPIGRAFLLGNGISNGSCNLRSHTCFVHAWCPTSAIISRPHSHITRIEQNSLNNYDDVDDSGGNSGGDDVSAAVSEMQFVTAYSVFIKSFVRFPYFNVHLTNFALQRPFTNESDESCGEYDPIGRPNCPIFRIGSVLRLANVSYSEIAQQVYRLQMMDFVGWRFDLIGVSIVQSQGGIISIHTQWECDFDSAADRCLPTYSFRRLDNPRANQNELSSGWNFRHARYYYEENKTSTRSPSHSPSFSGLRRDLYKLFGIRLEVSVSARAGRFHPVAFTFNLAASLVLLGGVSDAILLVVDPLSLSLSYHIFYYFFSHTVFYRLISIRLSKCYIITDVILLNLTRATNRYRAAKCTQFEVHPNLSAISTQFPDEIGQPLICIEKRLAE